MRGRVFVLAASVLVATVAGARAQTPADLGEWRADYEQRLRAEYGWLSVSGLTFLEPGVHTIGSRTGSDVLLPAGQTPAHVGRIEVKGATATLHLAPGVVATVDDEPVGATLSLVPPDGEPAPRVRVGDVEFHWHRSGERAAIRIRNPQSPLRTGFTGLQWFPPDSAYDVVGTLERHAEPQPVVVRNILGDAEDYTTPGLLRVTINGQTRRLVPLAASDGRLWLVFRDTTAGHATYGTRFLYAEPLGGDRYRVDFNRTYNPPCAYNPYTTCPTPLRENVLDLPIRAGEQLYEPGPNVTARR